MKTYGMLWTSTNTHKSTYNVDDVEQGGEEGKEEDIHGDVWGEIEGEEGVSLSRIASSALKDLAKTCSDRAYLNYPEKRIKKHLNSFAEVCRLQSHQCLSKTCFLFLSLLLLLL